MNKLFIIDLDDTVFETKTMGAEAVKPIIDGFKEMSVGYNLEMTDNIINDLWKYSFDFVIAKYKLNDFIKDGFSNLIDQMNFDLKISPFEDFSIVQSFEYKKILVTTGFKKLQQAKIDALNLEFDEVYIDDVLSTNRIQKKGIFRKIMTEVQVDPKSIFIIGDNPNAELKAGRELGLVTIQVSKLKQPRSKFADHFISDYSELNSIIESI